MTARVTALNVNRVMSAAGRVRSFLESDVERVADLHRRVFNSGGSPSAYREFFEEVFLREALRRDGISALVYEENDGTIIGFQGVQARHMIFEGKPLIMAVLSHYAVDPARRGVAGVRMLRHCLDGPQDLSLVDESGDGARKVWEWCGGKTALLYSMHWARPLRFSEALLTLIVRKRLPHFARVARPFARLIDSIFTRVSPLRVRTAAGSRHGLDESVMLAKIPEFAGDRSLWPDYSGSLTWLLERARTRSAGGPLRKIAVHDDKNEIAGWFLYYANRAGVAQVLQIAARKDMIGIVLDHLIEDASQCGAVALTGRLDPLFAQELSERYFVFYRRGHWTLVHSRRPELLQAIDRGDAFLSGLEGEFCLHFT